MAARARCGESPAAEAVWAWEAPDSEPGGSGFPALRFPPSSAPAGAAAARSAFSRGCAAAFGDGGGEASVAGGGAKMLPRAWRGLEEGG